ncbi:hypothetical protein ACQEU5_20495 [Marinactinospora thermotolerans]|nr:hypothetical protein [Marinactinospora thermotolerans]
MHAPADAVIAVRPDGWVRVTRRADITAGEAVVYSRTRFIAEGIVPVPSALEALTDRLTSRAARLAELELVA